jgi:5-methylthioadenosine/S-adenosylhomocysteine deaminase
VEVPIMNRIDTLIINATVLTMDDSARIFAPGQVAIQKDRIVDLGPWDPQAPVEACDVIDARGGLVMPGLINAHTHLPMAIFRGMADDLPLETWLQEYIFPAEGRHIAPGSAATGTRLSAAEMMLSGTTCCCDGYFLADHVAETLEQCGLRAISGQGVIDFPAPGISDPARKLDVARNHLERWRNRSELIRPSVFCHAPYTCSADTLKTAKALAREYGVLFQIHAAETRTEREQCIQTNGCSIVAYLDHLGVLDEDTLLIHTVWIDDDDIALMARRRSAAVHCPESNMKLASGVAPVPDMLDAGVRIGLGTDGCASNNDLDLLGEMDIAAKLHKVHRLDPTVMNADSVLGMATIGGARALGLDHLIGSLETGKQADLIIMDLNQPHLTPLYYLPSHIVYAARAADVQDVMIAGRWVVRNRQLLTIDKDDVLKEAVEMGRVIRAAGNGK